MAEADGRPPREAVFIRKKGRRFRLLTLKQDNDTRLELKRRREARIPPLLLLIHGIPTLIWCGGSLDAPGYAWPSCGSVDAPSAADGSDIPVPFDAADNNEPSCR